MFLLYMHTKYILYGRYFASELKPADFLSMQK